MMMSLPDSARERVVWASVLSLYDPALYGWGGDDPGVFEDCSGRLQEALRSVGLHPRPEVDLSADALYRIRIQAQCPQRTRLGAEAYWLTGDRATHVAVVVALNPALVVEAAGGGPDLAPSVVEDDVRATLAVLHVADGPDTSRLLRPMLAEQALRLRALQKNARVRLRPLMRTDKRKLIVLDPWGET